MANKMNKLYFVVLQIQDKYTHNKNIFKFKFNERFISVKFLH